MKEKVPQEKRVGVGVGLILIKGGRVLLGKRHSDPKKARSALRGEGTWTLPGGKLDFGEDFETGAARELEEETGIALPPSSLRVFCISNDKIDEAHFVTIGLYSAEEPGGEPRVAEPDKITEWRWFPLERLPEPLFFPSERVLENYRTETFYIRR